jgi:hypothetical protein
LCGGSIVAFLLAAGAGARLLKVSMGTVQINRGLVRTSPDPRLGFELRPNSIGSL